MQRRLLLPLQYTLLHSCCTLSVLGNFCLFFGKLFTWSFYQIFFLNVKNLDLSLNFAQLTARGGHISDLTIKQNLTKTDIVWCAHHVSLAALIALPTWQLSGIAKWKFISLSLLFFSSPRDQSWHCIPLNYSGVDDADIYVMMTQDGATYTVVVFVINCPRIVKLFCPLNIFITHFIVKVNEASLVAENFIRGLVMIYVKSMKNVLCSIKHLCLTFNQI